MELKELFATFPQRKNMSINKELTSKRCEKVWKALKIAQRNEVIELCGLSPATARNTYKKGVISAQLAISLAKIATMDPSYFTGESDRPGRYSERKLNEFLAAHDLSAQIVINEEQTVMDDAIPLIEPKPIKPARGKVTEHTDIFDYAGGNEDDADLEDIGGDVGADVTDEELVILLKSLIVRARYNPFEAELLADIRNALLA